MHLQRVSGSYSSGFEFGCGNKAKFISTGRHRCRKKIKQKKQFHCNKAKIVHDPLTQLSSCVRTKGPNARIICRILSQLGLTVNNLTQRELSAAIATILFQSMTMAAGIYTTLRSTTPAGVGDEEPSSEQNDTTNTSNLLVCLPDNSTSCVKYVNSTKNGLIELNESLYPALKAFRDDYDYRLIASINPFWLKFEPPTDTYYYTMAALYMFIFFVGTFGNGLVIYMFLRCKSLRTSPYMLVLNLAISDFMIVFKCPLAALNNYMRGPVMGDWGCRIYGFIGGFSGTASIGMLTIIALDRYSVVVNPLNPNRINYNTQYYAFWVLFVWLYALLFSSIPLADIGLSRYVPEGYFTTCSFDYLDTSLDARIFMFVFFICAWFVPLSVICYCYFHILNVVFTARENIQSNKNKQQIEIRLAIVVLMVILLWFLAWTPYSIVAICGIFEQEEYLTPTRAMIPALFCKSASCLNPFLYTISHKRFRHELLRLFCGRKPRLHYSMTRSSYMTKTSRKQRPLNTGVTGVRIGDDSIRRHDGVGGGSFNHQRQYAFKRNIRSASTIEGGLRMSRDCDKFPRSSNRSSMLAERSIAKCSGASSTSVNSIIAGPEGSGVFVIDARPSATSEEDVIFIVSGGRTTSLTRNSISTQVFVINTDPSDDIMAPLERCPPPEKHLETSF